MTETAMKIKIGVLLAVIIVGISLPTWAAIDVQVGDTVKLSGQLYSANQGPFKMTNVTGGNNFETFCAEVKEYFSPGSTYIVAGLSDKNVASNNFLTPYAAWVYTKYRTDAVWRSTIDTPTEYNWVQNAIWAGMVPGGSGTTPGGVGSEYWKHYNQILLMSNTNLANIGISDAEFALSGWTSGSLGNVRVANLVTPGRDHVNSQDQLVLVPEPMSVIVWSLLGLCVSCGIYWRKRKA
jgi:hypothetical protein